MLDLPVSARAPLILALEVALGLVLAYGYYAIKRRLRPRRQWHCRWLAVALAAKTLLFLWAMAPVTLRLVPSFVPTFDSLATRMVLVHGAVGVVSIVLGWWVVLVLRFKVPLGKRRTPHALRTPMRLAALTWAASLILGAILYRVWYL